MKREQQQRNYWEQQFSQYGQIWGSRPSQACSMALELFQQHGVRRLLIPGSGYGRNSSPFIDNAMEVTGVEISRQACGLARQLYPALTVINGSLFEHAVAPDDRYDAIFCYDVLHLFSAAERRGFIARCAELVRDGGLLFFTALSEQDDYFGQGAEREPGTFEVKPGKSIHFFTSQDLAQSFSAFTRLHQGELTDRVPHAEHGSRQYRIRTICVSKPVRNC